MWCILRIDDGIETLWNLIVMFLYLYTDIFQLKSSRHIYRWDYSSKYVHQSPCIDHDSYMYLIDSSGHMHKDGQPPIIHNESGEQ
jgi:hypothetical protein